MTGQRSQRWRLSTETSGKLWTRISPRAASPEAMWRPPAICSGAGARTATAHVETPRIITPSSTAWPPTGASREATSGGCCEGGDVDGDGSLAGGGPADGRSGSGCAADIGGRGYFLSSWRLAARRLKRSTRPPVSTSFWRPV